jgi:hypothetical protein
MTMITKIQNLLILLLYSVCLVLVFETKLLMREVSALLQQVTETRRLLRTVHLELLEDLKNICSLLPVVPNFSHIDIRGDTNEPICKAWLN